MMRKSLLFWILFTFLINQQFNAQKTYRIYVSSSGFNPDNLTINIGDTVIWQWALGTHTTTSDDQTSSEAWDANLNVIQWFFQKTFNTTGTYSYHCRIDTNESGLITVVDPVPVELTYFNAKYVEDFVLLEWETASEANNLGFNIERKKDNAGWSKIAFVQGKGTSSSSQKYSYKDTDKLESGVYYYRLKQIDLNGALRYYEKNKIDIKNENSFELLQNYPNPFNPTTSIKYVVPRKSIVQIKIYNVLGNEVATIINEEKQEGFYETTFDGSQLSSGIYYLQMKADNFQSIKKMILIR